MDWSLLALTIGPGLLILFWVYLKDRYEREPLGLVLICLVAGLLLPIPVLIANNEWQNAGFGISNNVLQTAIYAFVSVGGTEEGFKWLAVLLIAYPRKAFNEPFDGIVYAVAVSMGFAISENLLYVFYQSAGTDAQWVAIIRSVTAVPAHATFAILMGYFMGISKFSNNKIPLLLLGYLTAMILHGAYDFFLFLRNIPGISIGAFISLFIGIRLSRKAISKHQDDSPFRLRF